MNAHLHKLSLAWAAAAAVLGAAVPTAWGQALTPETALARAAERNPTLRAAVLDVTAARAAERAAVNARRPTVTVAADGAITERFSSTSGGVARSVDRSAGTSVELQYTTEWGTALGVGLGTDVSFRSAVIDPSAPTTVSIRPTYSSALSVSARQPLLRGAGADVTLSGIRESRASRTQTEHQRDTAASQLAYDVLVAYWELWYAERSLDVQRESERLAARQLAEARLRAEQLGTVAPTEVLRFSSELASIRESLTAAESDRDTRAIELGRLLGVSPAAAVGLHVGDAAPVTRDPEPLPTLLRAARTTSSDLLALEAQMEASRVRLLAAEDARQLRLDLTASLGVGGVWTRDSLPGLQLPDDRPALSAMLGLELELPLGESRQTAEAARARAQLEAARLRYEARVDAIEAQVASLRRRVQSATRRVELADESVRLATQLAEAERQRLALGTSTPWEVVQAQQSARQAALRRLRTVVDLASSEHQLDHVTGRLLRRLGSVATTTRAAAPRPDAPATAPAGARPEPGRGAPEGSS